MALLISNQDIEQVLDMKTCLDAIEEGIKEYYRDGEEILGVGGNQIQGIQFASVGGATYRLIKDQGLGREFSTDWLLQDIRN